MPPAEMAPLMRTPISSCCWRSLLGEWQPQRHSRRTLVTLQRGPVERLSLPTDLPASFLSQIPKRLRPDNGKQKIKVYRPPPSEWQACKDPVGEIDSRQLALLDPTGARAKLFDKHNKDCAKVGDILLTTFKTGDPFSGVILSIKSRGPATSVLLRNQYTRVGTEMAIKIHSPLVQSMEIAQRAPKRKRRARLYYMRKPEHDMGSVQKVVDQYLRQKALLTGGKAAQQSANRSRRGKR